MKQNNKQTIEDIIQLKTLNDVLAYISFEDDNGRKQCSLKGKVDETILKVLELRGYTVWRGKPIKIYW